MAKKNLNLPPVVISLGIVLIVLGLGVSFFVSKTVAFFKTSNYFRVQYIDLDASLSFIHKQDLTGLKGQNIFTVDLKKLHRKIFSKYSQISQLRIYRRFPNRIVIKAANRFPFAKIHIKDKLLIVDEFGYPVFVLPQQNTNLPEVLGIKISSPRIVFGQPITHESLKTALYIIKFFQTSAEAKRHVIRRVNAENLSKIFLELTSGLSIIMDGQNLNEKVRMLNLLIAQKQIDLRRTNYIDLRFKEPVMGMKEEAKASSR